MDYSAIIQQVQEIIDTAASTGATVVRIETMDIPIPVQQGLRNAGFKVSLVETGRIDYWTIDWSTTNVPTPKDVADYYNK